MGVDFPHFLAHWVFISVTIVAATTHAKIADGQNVQCTICVSRYHVPNRMRVEMMEEIQFFINDPFRLVPRRHITMLVSGAA